MKRTLIGLMGLFLLTSAPAFARIRLQDNPGFIVPVPNAQQLGIKKPAATEYVDETEKQTLAEAEDAPSITGQTFSKYTLDGHPGFSKRDIKKIVRPYLGKPMADSDIETLSKSLSDFFAKGGLKDSHVQLLQDHEQADTLQISVYTKKVGSLIVERDPKKKAHTWEF